MKISFFPVASTLLFLALGLAVTRGQAPALDQIDQSKRAREANQLAQEAVDSEGAAPELFEGESSDLGPQTILRLKRKRHFEVIADSQVFHTDNFFLTDSDEKDATALVNTLQVALAPTGYDLGPGKLAPRLGIRQQWYNFGLIGRESGGGIDYDKFDFDAQTAFVDGRYHFGKGWIAELGLDATRLIDHSSHHELYKELAPHWGLQQRFELCPFSQLLLGYEGVFHASSAESSVPPGFRLTDRVDQTLFAALSVVCGERFVAQPYYRFRYTDFLRSDRSDYLHSVGLGMYYFFTSQLSLRGYLAYDHRDSHHSPVPDYEKLNLGGGVNFTLSF